MSCAAQDSSVLTCLEGAVKAVSELALDATSVERCEAFKEVTEAQVSCMKECSLFRCQSDAKDFMRLIDASWLHELECGGIDFIATCNTEELISNNAPAMIPNECIDDPGIRTCREAIPTAGEECSGIAQAYVDDYLCLSECDTFNCNDLRVFFDFAEELLQNTECKKIDFEESCLQGKVVGAADGVKVGASLFLLVGALVVRMLN